MSGKPKRQTLTTPPLQCRVVPRGVCSVDTFIGYCYDTKYIACKYTLCGWFPNSNFVDGIRIRLSRRKSKNSRRVEISISVNLLSIMQVVDMGWAELTKDAGDMIHKAFGDNMSGPFYLSILEVK